MLDVFQCKFSLFIFIVDSDIHIWMDIFFRKKWIFEQKLIFMSFSIFSFHYPNWQRIKLCAKWHHQHLCVCVEKTIAGSAMVHSNASSTHLMHVQLGKWLRQTKNSAACCLRPVVLLGQLLMRPCMLSPVIFWTNWEQKVFKFLEKSHPSSLRLRARRMHYNITIKINLLICLSIHRIYQLTVMCFYSFFLEYLY